jgi:hypothetical protein
VPKCPLSFRGSGRGLPLHVERTIMEDPRPNLLVMAMPRT